jgi:hypothetical protein
MITAIMAVKQEDVSFDLAINLAVDLSDITELSLWFFPLFVRMKHANWHQRIGAQVATTFKQSSATICLKKNLPPGSFLEALWLTLIPRLGSDGLTFDRVVRLLRNMFFPNS